MLRCNNNIYWDTTANLITHDPLLPAGTLIVDIETGLIKTSDGVHRFSSLPSSGVVVIGNKYIQGGSPYDNSILWYNNATTLWEFSTRGIIDTLDNIEGDPTVFPTYALIIEKNEFTNQSTGRFKLGDGITSCNSLPWITGINVYGEFATGEIGKSIEWDGCQWIPKEYTTSFATDTPTGKFLRDDMEWSDITSLPALESVTSDIGEFGTIYIGSAPTEPTSVTLTSPDGETLYVDGQKVWTEYNDGTGSGLDADTLDGHHSTAFATGPLSATEGNIVTFGSSPNKLIDSGYTPLDFIVLEALVYKGAIDCTSYPDFPAAEVGDLYKVSNDGLIGGEFGTTVVTGDNIVCNTNTEAGEFASVGVYWDIIPNYTGDSVTGPSSSSDSSIVLFNGTTGKIVKDSGYYTADFLGATSTAVNSDKLDGMEASDFATTGDIETVEENALVYSIVFGG